MLASGAGCALVGNGFVSCQGGEKLIDFISEKTEAFRDVRKVFLMAGFFKSQWELYGGPRPKDAEGTEKALGQLLQRFALLPLGSDRNIGLGNTG
jgi:hypothetical protein